MADHVILFSSQKLSRNYDGLGDLFKATMMEELSLFIFDATIHTYTFVYFIFRFQCILSYVYVLFDENHI